MPPLELELLELELLLELEELELEEQTVITELIPEVYQQLSLHRRALA